MEDEPCLQPGKNPKTENVSGPDGNEAWSVAFAGFIINFIMAGLGRMSGILYIAFIDIFQTDRRQASLPFSVRSSMRNLLGPLVGILGQKYGVRPVIILGGILGAVSAFLCGFVDSMSWITVVWGGLNGIGTALTTILPQVIIGQHFEKYRTTASGIAFSGGCIGSFVFPVLLEFLLHKYGLGGTFFVISGILLNVIPAAMVMKTPTWSNKKPTPLITVSPVNDDDIGLVVIADESQVQNSGEANSANKNVGKFFVANKNEPGFSVINYCLSENLNRKPVIAKRPDTHLLWENRKLVIRLLTDDFTLQCPASEINQKKSFVNDALAKEIEDLFFKIVTDVQNGNISENDSASDTCVKVNGEFQDKCEELGNSTYISGSSKTQMPDFDLISSNPLNCFSFFLENLFKTDRCVILQPLSLSEHEHMSKILEELWKIHKILNDNKTNKNLRFCSTASLFLENDPIHFEVDGATEHPNTFSSHIKTALKLHMKPLFLLICLCRSVHFLTFMPIVTTIVDFAMDKGLPEDDGKYILAALSSGDLVGRVCLGWITDKGFVTLPRFMLCVMVIQGVSTATLPLVDSRASLMVAIAVFGVLQGSIFVRHPVLVAGYLESYEQSIAMGCINFLSGVIAFALPDYIGYFRDTIGSYSGVFYINGALGAFIGLLWLFEPYFIRMSISNSKCNQQAQV